MGNAALQLFKKALGGTLHHKYLCLCCAASGVLHRQGDVGGGVVSVQKQVDGGFGHVCDRLYDGGADVPPGGKIKDAVIADDLHILWDPDPPANQEFADPDSQAVGVAEDAVKFQLSLPNVIVQELIEGGGGVFVPEKQALVGDLCLTAGAFKAWAPLVRLAVDIRADAEKQEIPAAKFHQLLGRQLASQVVV